MTGPFRARVRNRALTPSQDLDFPQAWTLKTVLHSKSSRLDETSSSHRPGPLYQAPRHLCQHKRSSLRRTWERGPDPLTSQLRVGWAIGTWNMAAGLLRMLCIASQTGVPQKEAANGPLDCGVLIQSREPQVTVMANMCKPNARDKGTVD